MARNHKSSFLYRTHEDELAADNDDLVDGWIISEFSKKCFLANDVICYQGEVIDKVYFIRSGNIRLLNYLTDGEARNVRLYTAGDWLGLEGLIGLPYEYTAEAVDDVDVVYFPLKNSKLLANSKLH